MKCVLAASILSVLALVGCQTPPVQRVEVPSAQNPNAYIPTVQEKPLPPEATGQPMPGAPANPRSHRPTRACLPKRPSSAPTSPTAARA